MHVAICFRVPDPRLEPACTPSDVAKYTLLLPTASKDPQAAAALLGALGTLPGSTVGGRHGREVTFSSPLNTVTCTPQVTVSVPVGGVKRLRGRTTVTGGAPDNDASLRLRCVAS